MSIKEGNERVVVTMDHITKEQLLFLCKFLRLSKSKTIDTLIKYYYEKLKQVLTNSISFFYNVVASDNGYYVYHSLTLTIIRSIEKGE